MPLKTTDLRRAAQKVVNDAALAQRGRVQTLWQKSTEEDESFAFRALEARTRLHASIRLVVVAAVGAVPQSRGLTVCEMPKVMLGLFDKPARYRACFGGRRTAPCDSGHSRSFANGACADFNRYL